MSTYHRRADKSDPVNHPSHYCRGGIEVLDAIEAWGLDYHRGNAIKYIARAGHKDPAKEAEDLRKAIFYLRRKIDLVRKRKKTKAKVKVLGGIGLHKACKAWELDDGRLYAVEMIVFSRFGDQEQEIAMLDRATGYLDAVVYSLGVAKA